MRLHFEANQDYQIAAVEAVAALFEGQPLAENRLHILENGGFAITPNQLDLTDSDLLHNLRNVQNNNKLTQDEQLKVIEATVDTAEGQQGIQFPNFSIDMETGTGKTYVYIRTALELARRYGMQKFIIVVPSVAIREGVLKTLEITEGHLKELYSNLPYRYTAYDSGSLSRLKQFVESNVVEFLIMTISAFEKKDTNVIWQKDREQMRGVPPLHLIQSARPILILDEPQNFKTGRREDALASLNPLFALRYSATHPKGKEFNRVYRLSPYEAYRRGLVKKIEVAGIQQVGSGGQPFMRLEAVATAKKTLTAKLTLHVLNKSGTIQEKSVIIKATDDRTLEAHTHLPDYNFTIEDIFITEQAVSFSNGLTLEVGETTGADKTALFDAQIRYTIEEHFRKQARLKASGIKVLSLFFIDKVENYASQEGIIRQLFNRAFDEFKANHLDWRDLEAETVQGAYFAQKRTKEGTILYEESKTGETDKDKEAYDAILKAKEDLLTFPAPDDDPKTRRIRQMCFIFSHSALREGWDNPNVFQICTLNQSTSEMRKRQEIGRGVRLAVNQEGLRVRDEKLNVLTVIANQSYEGYVQSLQREVEEDYGLDGAPPKPADARARGVARLNGKIYELSPEFKDLWERIKHKTRYAVQVDTDKLLAEVELELNDMEIAPPRTVVSRGVIHVTEGDDTYNALGASVPRTLSTQPAHASGQNLIEMVLHMLQFTAPPIRLTRHTLMQLFQNLDSKRREQALNNPQEFASVAVRLLRAKLADQLVDGIRYERINDWYEMTQFESEVESWKEYLVPVEKCVYDHVIFDSRIERQFALDLEKQMFVKAYVKLPHWFTVPTPIGTYNPDWAIVAQQRDEYGTPVGDERLYLVSETKSTTNVDELRPDERRKIECGRKHFEDALGITYRHVTSVNELFSSI